MNQSKCFTYIISLNPLKHDIKEDVVPILRITEVSLSQLTCSIITQSVGGKRHTDQEKAFLFPVKKFVNQLNGKKISHLKRRPAHLSPSLDHSSRNFPKRNVMQKREHTQGSNSKTSEQILGEMSPCQTSFAESKILILINRSTFHA